MVQNKEKNPDFYYYIINTPIGVDDVLYNHTISRYWGKYVAKVTSIIY